MARLGERVSLFEQRPALSVPDKDIAKALLAIVGRDMAVNLGVEVERSAAGDAIRLRWTGASTGEDVFDHVLVATGRPPEWKGLDLARAGIELDEKSRPTINPDTLQAGTSAIFFAGDAAADRPVLHEASLEGAIAGRNAAAFPEVKPARRAIPFTMMFTSPPLAIIGDTGKEDSVIGAMDFADQGRAKVMNKAEGLVRIHADPRDGRLLGALMLGPEIDQSAHLLCWAIEWGKSASDLLDLPFYHPTLVEGLKTALREICAGVHAPVPAERDQGSPPGS
jgi:dihydrolipoamide dehydrogenase